MISPETLQAVGDAVSRDANVSALRQAFPELHFTECSEDDVSPRFRPALSVDDFALYLISGCSGHCLELTHDADSATGILLAAKADEE